MRRIVNECVDCRGVGLHCQGYSCPNLNVEVLVCDECGEEAELYYYAGQELCADCVLEQLEKV